ncbi:MULTISPECIES: type III secretion system export apparatus subunit SctR [unclassified Aureimonas]|uniref:type III secretion system export apparatus subunit SctR n=1 Tax=unclassified Aureimonas TaxID=2615206 RepID=UPI0006FD057B|nr:MULTISPECIES: type III secretion system export apparatus subunit SctR [unclassified Aureimonas]KQT60033.1 type III secretion system protein SsaR [Aureimonas sp. Leaf427]KQT79587.1 type III secretion system protein SsaR [Aureimonas sp. Leaf460]
MTADPNLLFGTLALFAIVSFLPLLAVAATAFTKISVVLLIVRNALGIQQTPPNLLVFAVAMVLTGFVMVPVGSAAYEALSSGEARFSSPAEMLQSARLAAAPFRAFLLLHADPDMRAFFVDAARRSWPPNLADTVGTEDLAILVPAFMAAELTRAFEIGFLIYLPFLLIDFATSAILIALGMQMMSPPIIATPLKLLLFTSVEGWRRLFEGLVLSYGAG